MAKARRHVIGTTGDVNLFDYDAGVIFSDKYGIHWEWWNNVAEWDSSRPNELLLHETDVPDNVFEYHNWANVKSIASSVGISADELRKLGASTNVRDRVEALEALNGHSGASALDSSPITITRAELKRRWKNIK